MIMYRTGAVDVLGHGSQLFFFVVTLPPSLLVATLSYRWLELRATGQIRKRIDRISTAKHGLEPVSP
jgi:hypothetical protein